MTDLTDTFGPEFAEHVEQRTKERRQERERLTDETKAAIADKAINQQGFHGGDPMFEYTSENGITHNVLLMQLAEPREGSVWNMARELGSGAISVPLEYLGQWIWSIFNDVEEAKKLEHDKWYIVAGNLDTWEPDDGDPQDQLSPVRGIMSLDEAKELADQAMDDEGFGDAEDTSDSEDAVPDDPFGDSEEESEDEEPEEDEGPSGIFGGEEEEEAEEEPEPEPEDTTIDATVSDIYNVVEDLADEEEEVWEVNPEHGDWDTFLLVLHDKLGLDYEDENVRDQVAEIAMDRVDEGPKGDQAQDEPDSLF